MKVYLDNAATTPLDPEVFEAMTPYFMEQYGNPSSIHAYGRAARSAVEKSRKTIADLLNTSPSEIFFTSGGTEADNTAICSSLDSFGIQHAITSKLEHHAILHTLEFLEKKGKVKTHFVDINEHGTLDLSHLDHLLKTNSSAFVSIMHANNEIGNINDIKSIGELCDEHGAVFHSDTVQAIGKIVHDLSDLKAQFIIGAAHKFHGPKGTGFMYINGKRKIDPIIHGGGQERNMRGGTENVAGIVGIAKALEVAYRDMAKNKNHIEALKNRMINGLKESISNVSFNGNSDNLSDSIYTVLNVSLPASGENDMLLFNLDIKGVSASGGSACASGSSIGSHVLTALGADPNRGAIRFSFSKFTKPEEIDYAIKCLKECFSE